ncbi:outer membrane protein assembly factor BamB [Micromonospora sp. A202]|uniref:PQQ-binding-like beta-propeller repeat protein n=1 Tax=Micromonospora sp. A202 TaxID=2572899 RepID=UPI00114FBDE7|nr:PQQ-binding-like beta-propeller repeat protein [Micromonospora sp. A202]TQJ23973.1 outer membrane protein assembly factor BamB [Micromonospora sp. A202]
MGPLKEQTEGPIDGQDGTGVDPASRGPDAAGARHLRVRDLAWFPMGLALLFLGVLLPLREVYVVGCVLAPAGIAVVVFRTRAWTLTTRPRPVLVVTVALATVVAGTLITAPRVTMARLDAPFLWRIPGPVNEVQVLPHVLLTSNDETLWGHNPETGAEIFTIRRSNGPVNVGPDGSVVVQNGDQVRYYDAQGSLVWQQVIAGARSTVKDPRGQEVVAMGIGLVVLRNCAQGGCVYTGYGTSGGVVWRATGYHENPVLGAAPHRKSLTSRGINVAPTVVAIPAQPDSRGTPVTGSTIVRGADGRILGTTRGDVTAVIGDTVVLDVGSCQLAAARAGQTLWTTQGLPCEERSGLRPHSPRYFKSRIYLPTFTDGEMTGAATIDLDDGQWRMTGPLLTGYFDDVLPPATAGVAGDDIWVERHGSRLTGVDAATGTKLWTFHSPDHIPASVGNGTVVVTSVLNGRLTELAGHPLIRDRSTAYLVTVLDARTGRTTARLIMTSSHSAPTAFGTAPGQAFIQGWPLSDEDDKYDAGVVGRPAPAQ